MKRFSYPLTTLKRKPGRTAALIILTALLAMSIFGGSLVMVSLRRGLNSMEARLGADIIVVPSEAASKVNLKDTLLQGTLGPYYISEAALSKVSAVEGVAQAAPQLFLSTLKADCCSTKVQVIGFDPEHDFIVQPWIAESYGQPLEDMDVVVGCRVETAVGHSLKIYDESCRVVARLAETGTGLDTAVYCNWSTISALLKAAEDKGISHKMTSDSVTAEGSGLISAIYVKVDREADVDQVFTQLSHIRKTAAVKTKSMLTEVADSLAGVSRTVSLLIAAVWILALAILLIAFVMMVRERRREFAVLRLLGTSRRMLRSLVIRECAACSLAGALCGTALGAALVFSFTALIESLLGLPYLTPTAGTVLLLALATVAVTVLVGALTGGWASERLCRVDPGTVLREGA